MEAAIEWEDNEDVPVDISCDGSGQGGFTKGYKTVGDGIVHNEEWDETAEVKKTEREESGFGEGGVKENGVDMGEVAKSEVEASNYFEGCE